jgi:Fe/S biogenesis protein NfuA
MSSKNDPWANPRSVQSADQPAADTPAETGAGGGDLTDRVRKVLEEMINPALAAHGGFINLIEVRERKVYVEMGGGCQGCGAAMMTLKAGVERMLKEEIPEIEEVLDQTDHTAGSNPYYATSK